MLATTFLLFVTVCNFNGLDAAVTQREIEESLPIFFPGGETDFVSKFGNQDVPDSCKDQTYCTVKPENYPEEVFNKMFKDIKTIAQPTLVLDSMLTNRQGEPEGKDDCETEVTYEPLYQVRAKRDSEWAIVVQAPKVNYVQQVRLEKCLNTEGACFNALPLTPDIKTLCVQKFNKWKFLVAKGQNETETLEVELPVCCSCQYKPPSIETRFGVSKKMSTPKTLPKRT